MAEKDRRGTPVDPDTPLLYSAKKYVSGRPIKVLRSSSDS